MNEREAQWFEDEREARAIADEKAFEQLAWEQVREQSQFDAAIAEVEAIIGTTFWAGIEETGL